MINCKICNKEFTSVRSLCHHIKIIHEIKSEEYYLKYISTDPMDGKCHNINCTNNTKYISFSKGFSRYCSRKCASNSDETKEKIKGTNIEKYGVEYRSQSQEFMREINNRNLKKYGFKCVFQSPEIKDKIKQTNLEKYGVEYSLLSDDVKIKCKKTCLERYGVEHYTQSTDFIKKSKRTCLEKYGYESSSKCEEVKKKRTQTCFKKYGVEHVSQCEEFKEKSKKTCLKKYNVEYIFQSEKIKEKIKLTNLKRYGVEYSSKCDRIKKKRSQTCLKRYGVEYPAKLKEIRKKMENTCFIKYGVKNAFQLSDRKKIKATCLKKYGVSTPLQSKEIRKKAKRTMLERYGVEHALQSEEIKRKVKNTCIDRYGVENPFQSEIIKEKIRRTCLKKYGAEYPSKTEEFKEKSKKSCLIRYGVQYPQQSNDVRLKSSNTCFQKYGTNYFFQTKEFREKYKNICLKRYGVEYPSKCIKIKEKLKHTRIRSFFNLLLTSNRLNGKVTPNFTVDDYKGVDYKYSWKCIKCGTIFDDHLQDGKIPKCTTCYPSIYGGSSQMELELYNFINEKFQDAVSSDKSIISPLELDIYIPSKKLAIEFDGLYWHSELNGGKDSNYHLNKMLSCNSKNIELVHVFEDEWVNKKEIVKSILCDKLGVINNKIYSRKCIVDLVLDEEASVFMNKNHIKGYVQGKHLGLYYNNELVSLLTYEKPRLCKNYDIEILMICNKLYTTVIGGISKLVKTLYNKSIITYIDARYDNGKLFKSIGFTQIDISKPSYYYVNHKIRYNSSQLEKCIVDNKLKIFDETLAEWENMKLNNYDRIWDCGNYVLEYKPTN